MSDERPQEPEAETRRTGARYSRRLQTGVRGLIVIVACCGVITWAARSVWETHHPAVAAARGLESPKPSDRARAARDLMQTGVKDPGLATPPLIAALGDPAAEVRETAAEALGVLGCEKVLSGSAGDAPRTATAGLIRSLKDREPAVQVAALSALKRIASAKGAASAIDCKEVVSAIATRLDDRDEEVRMVALDALALCGPLGSDDPPAALVAALEDRSAKIRAAAVKSLASFPRPLDPWLSLLFRALEHDEPEVGQACWWAIVRGKPPAFSSEAIPALMATLGSRARVVRFFAARALEPHSHDPRVARVLIPALLALMRDPIELDRRNAVVPDTYMTLTSTRILGGLSPGTAWSGEVVAALAESVRSDHWARRQAAIQVLREFGPAAEPAIPALVQVVREALGDKYVSVRFEVQSLGSFEVEAAAGVLAMIAFGTRPAGFVSYDVQTAADTLAKIAPGTRSAGEVIATLADVVRTRRLSRRTWAVEALGAFGPVAEPAVPALVQFLRETIESKNPEVAREGPSVARVLAKVAPETVSTDAARAALTEALETDSEARLGAIAALPAFGPKAAGALPRLRAWKNGSVGRLKWAATSALRAIEGATSVDRKEEGDKGKEFRTP
jgi:HEAT repeat protein